MSVWWKEKFNDVVIFCFEFLVWWPDLFCWQILVEVRTNGIPSFWSWRRLSPSRFMGDQCLVNCEACEWISVDLISGHLLVSAEGWLEEEWELCEFIGENVWFVELNSSALISSICVSICVLSISSCYLIAVSNLLMLVILMLSRRFS